MNMQTIGADREGAYATHEVIPESDVMAKSAYIAKKDPLLTLPKLQSQEMRISQSTRCPAMHSVLTGSRIRKVQKFSINLTNGNRPLTEEWGGGESSQDPMNGSICLTWEQRDASYAYNDLRRFPRILDAAEDVRSRIGMNWTKSESRQCRWATEMMISTERSYPQLMHS